MKAGHQEAARALQLDRLVSRSSGKTLPVLDPSTKEKLCEMPVSSAADVDAAVAAARKAFEGEWGRMSPGRRRDCLEKLAQRLAQEEKALSQMEALDVGTPVSIGRQLTAKAAGRVTAYYASWVDKLYGTVVPMIGSQPMLDYTLREPVGVVAAIIPWNTPLLFLGSKVGAALACGNAVVVKPSEVAPLSALRWAQLCAECGFPEGAINIVTGDGEVGSLLAGHPGVDLVSFTGGSQTGPKVARAAAGKRLALELGGKSAALVFADGDIDKAAMSISLGVFGLTGQACAASSRLLVENSVADAVVEKVIEMARSLQPGDPLEKGTMLGPLASEAQLARVCGHVSKAKQAGAKLLCGGEPLGGDGYFFPPTVFDGVKPEMAIAKEEVFGPVLSVIRFSSEEEALAVANGTSYGLAAGIFSRDVSRVHRLARAVRAGMVWVNGYGQLPVQAPFGGVGGSGFGREGGQEALDTFTQVKNVLIEL